MTKEQAIRRLNAVHYLVESDTGAEADFVAGGMEKNATRKEKEFAKLIIRIYTLIHPTSDCKNPHENWEKENEELMKLADENYDQQRIEGEN